MQRLLPLLFINVVRRNGQYARVLLSLADEGAEEKVGQADSSRRSDECAERAVFIERCKKIGFIVARKILLAEGFSVAFGLQFKGQVDLEVVQRIVFIQWAHRFIRHVHHALCLRRGVDRHLGKHQRATNAGVMNHQALP